MEILSQMLKKLAQPSWDLTKAVEFCTLLETVAPKHGFHVGLTGGCLYKDGTRKDCDVLIYRIRTDGKPSNTPLEYLWTAFEELDVTDFNDYGFVVKAKYDGFAVDFLIPEEPDSGYEYSSNN